MSSRSYFSFKRSISSAAYPWRTPSIVRIRALDRSIEESRFAAWLRPAARSTEDASITIALNPSELSTSSIARTNGPI